ncbi:hypothetical protein V6N13_093366 [Hibiscus sabdariffa]
MAKHEEKSLTRAITGYIGDVGRLKGDSNVEEGGMQSDNKFDLLVDVVDGREKLNLSPKKSRLIDGVVMNLVVRQLNIEVLCLIETRVKKILGVGLTDELTNSSVSHVSRKEIKDVLFSMNGNKIHGLDGYLARFFQLTWNVVGGFC